MVQPEWVAIGLIAGSQLYSIFRNGRTTKKAIRDEMAEMKQICAGTRATFKTRLDNHDRELKDIKKP